MGRPQFVVETGDKCFICLEGIPSIKIDPAVREKEGDDGNDDPHTHTSPASAPAVTFSFQNIFQYVKVDVSDILHPRGVSMAGSSNNNSSCPTLEGRLCSGCGQLSQQFSSYFHELVATRMKLDTCLKSIYDKMVGVTPGSEEDAVVDELRRRAVEGCSKKLSIVSPQVTVEKWTDVAILPHDLEMKVESDPDVDMDITISDTAEPDLVDLGPTYLRAQTPTNKLEETEDNSNSYMECDICHLKVMDLFAHHATAHNTSNLATQTLKLLENECNLCGKKFAKKWALGRHKRQQHHLENIDESAGDLLGTSSSPTITPQLDDIKPGPGKDSSNEVKGNTTPATGYQCDKCNTTFTKRQSLQMHQRNLNGCCGVVGGGPSLVCTCRICGKEFATLDSMRRHIKRTHKDLHQQLKEHVSQAATTTPSDSGIAPTKQSKLTPDPPKETFILPDIGPDPDPAQEEDPPSSTPDRPQDQEEGEPGIDRNYNCKFCPRPFFSRNGLARHLALAHLSKIATKVADTTKGLSSDNQSYTPVYSSHSQAEVQNLIEEIHPDPLTKTYFCPGPGCKLEFEGPRKGYEFRCHYRAAHLNVRYECKLCSKQFLRTDYCDQHYRDHHMAFRYSCNGCGTRFTKDKLGQHLWKGRCFT